MKFKDFLTTIDDDTFIEAEFENVPEARIVFSKISNKKGVTDIYGEYEVLEFGTFYSDFREETVIGIILDSAPFHKKWKNFF